VPGVIPGDRRVPRLQVVLGNQVLVVRADEQADLLERGDEGRIDPARFMASTRSWHSWSSNRSGAAGGGDAGGIGWETVAFMGGLPTSSWRP
jgi:hypothetical protein